jgi:hypothetical protein
VDSGIPNVVHERNESNKGNKEQQERNKKGKNGSKIERKEEKKLWKSECLISNLYNCYSSYLIGTKSQHEDR